MRGGKTMSTREALYGVGQKYEQEAARRLAANGWIVVPMSEFTNNTGIKINAPMLVIPDGVAISPDLLAIKPGKQIWFEVKDKTEPTYTWKLHRWEHGIDKPNADDYLLIEEKSDVPVILLIHEKNSPETPDLYLSSMDDIGAYKRMKSDLKPSDIWLSISLKKAFENGNIRNGNKEMIGPKNKLGAGLYWPRIIMNVWIKAND